METHHIFQCEDSLEGIFTGVYEGWAARVGHGNVEIRTADSENLELFCEYHRVETDLEKAEKVLRTIKDRLKDEITERICYAASSCDPGKGTAIYRTLVDCLSAHGASLGKKTLENLKNPAVRKVVELHRSVWNEYHHYLGFIRFRQLPGNVLFSAIQPKNDVLMLFQEHFGDRFSGEYWVIYDENRGKALLHQPYLPCYILSQAEETMERLQKMKDTQRDFETLFQGFCHHISIKERENRGLQRQNLPMRFRKHMVEFNKI